MENLNGLDLFGIISGLVVVAELIVKWTPTKKDDKYFFIVSKILLFWVKSRKKGGGTH